MGDSYMWILKKAIPTIQGQLQFESVALSATFRGKQPGQFGIS